jgi:hypothetical protein
MLAGPHPLGPQTLGMLGPVRIDSPLPAYASTAATPMTKDNT